MTRLVTILLLALAPGDPVDFAREVRPILAEHCFACHGPDAAARKADLRLDLEEDAVRDRGGYAVIDRSSTADSELLLRLHGDGVLERIALRDIHRLLGLHGMHHHSMVRLST